MGIRTETREICTCDMCSKECLKTDREISIVTHPGDGRDVGPSRIFARLTLSIPYGPEGGIICIECKKKWLTKYLEEI